MALFHMKFLCKLTACLSYVGQKYKKGVYQESISPHLHVSALDSEEEVKAVVESGRDLRGRGLNSCSDSKTMGLFD